jgi:hypothetical protein
MLIKPPELTFTCKDLSKAFKELKPDCGGVRTYELERGVRVRHATYKSKLPGLNYLGIRSDCIFCIDKEQEELVSKVIKVSGQGKGLVFVYPHILRDILKVTDKDSTIVMYPLSRKEDRHTVDYTVICAEGCTWELKYEYEFPGGLIPPETKPETNKPVVPVRQAKPEPKRV